MSAAITEPQTVSDRIAYGRLEVMTACTAVISQAVGQSDSVAAKGACKVLWKLHAAGVRSMRAMLLSDSGQRLAREAIAKERIACQQIQLAVNRIFGAKNDE